MIQLDKPSIHKPGQQLADALLVRMPKLPLHWSYDYDVVFKGMQLLWTDTGDSSYLDYMKTNLAQFITDDGNILDYRVDEYNIDHINNGKGLLYLYRLDGNERWKKAIDLLCTQLENHPRTKAGGYWHKEIYPWQMWLDGLYMGQPFRAEYAAMFHQSAIFDDVASQLLLMEEKARDTRTGLLYHAWDESRQMPWSNPVTGCSPNFWSRAMGWYLMSLVDCYEHFPIDHAARGSIAAVLKRAVSALRCVQDEKTGLWYQILDGASIRGNYLEASGSAMFICAIAKGIRLGMLEESFKVMALEAYQGLVERFLFVDNDGMTSLTGTVQVSGLGNVPYRDGSWAYYFSEPIRINDLKGVGAFIQASSVLSRIVE